MSPWLEEWTIKKGNYEMQKDRGRRRDYIAAVC